METRSRETLKQTLNTAPRRESIVQNQMLMLEVMCDIRQTMNDLMGLAKQRSYEKVRRTSGGNKGIL